MNDNLCHVCIFNFMYFLLKYKIVSREFYVEIKLALGLANEYEAKRNFN